MKKLLIILAIVFMASASWAAPFLVCDEPVGETVEKYTGMIDGQPFETPYSLHPSGGAIVFDMQGMDLTVPHDFSDIKACNVMGCSAPATSFSSPTAPSSPTNLNFKD